VSGSRGAGRSLPFGHRPDPCLAGDSRRNYPGPSRTARGSLRGRVPAGSSNRPSPSAIVGYLSFCTLMRSARARGRAPLGRANRPRGPGGRQHRSSRPRPEKHRRLSPPASRCEQWADARRHSERELVISTCELIRNVLGKPPRIHAADTACHAEMSSCPSRPYNLQRVVVSVLHVHRGNGEPGGNGRLARTRRSGQQETAFGAAVQPFVDPLQYPCPPNDTVGPLVKREWDMA
jgi:hypothetical protein